LNDGKCIELKPQKPVIKRIMETFRARASYQWKMPDSKTHHGYSMCIVESAEKSEQAVKAAIKTKYPKLAPYEIVIVRLEWR
jgi:hypothetical protein